MRRLARQLARRRGLAILIGWLLLLGAVWLVSWLNGISLIEQVQNLLRSLQDSPYAWLWLLLFYALRPFTLLPASILTVFAGFLFGPVPGSVFAVLAGSGTAAISYWLATLITRPRPEGAEGIERRLRENAFEAVLTFRLMALPGDLLNYLCGSLRVPLRSFLLATIIGSIPGTVMGVLAGASVQGAFTFEGVSVRWEFLVLSALLLVLGLAVSAWLRKREAARSGNDG